MAAMKRRLIFLAAGAVAAVAVRRLLPSGHDMQGHFAPVVSINRTAVDIGKEPSLASLTDQHAVEISEERGGTVLRARTDEGPSWRKLREAKQLLETGEVLRVDGQPHGLRKPLGAALERVGQAVKERTR